jgi:cation:H+ antiporter
VVVVLAGVVMARQADRIAELTGLGRLWIGSVLLAAATSLPELTTDVAAVRMEAADLAVGDLFGSSMANMLILALIDLRPPRGQVMRMAALDHALAACLGISLNALAAVFVLARPQSTALGVGPSSLILVAVYLAGTRAVYRHALRNGGSGPEGSRSSRLKGATLRRTLLGFLGATLAISAAAPVFAWSAKGIAEISGLGMTFVGTWLVGFSTSLPELVASIAAVRLGAFDLAVGNLFGSNAFNMALFFALDLAQPGPAIFASLDASHALSALLAILLMSLGLAAIVYRAERRFAMLEPSSLLMLVTYILGMWMMAP